MDVENSVFALNKRSANLAVIVATSAAFLILLGWERLLGGQIQGENSVRFLLEHGALYGPAVLVGGEWYRLVTYLFLHGGIEHIVNNMLILYFMGNSFERLAGRLRYGIVYFSSGVLAGVGSILYNGYRLTGSLSLADMASARGYPVCIGASGAVFGVVGAMAYLVVLYRGRIQGLGRRQMIWFVVLSVYGGFADSGVDNAAHIAGLAAGFLLAAALCRKPKTPETSGEGGTYAD